MNTIAFWTIVRTVYKNLIHYKIIFSWSVRFDVQCSVFIPLDLIDASKVKPQFSFSTRKYYIVVKALLTCYFSDVNFSDTHCQRKPCISKRADKPINLAFTELFQSGQASEKKNVKMLITADEVIYITADGMW